MASRADEGRTSMLGCWSEGESKKRGKERLGIHLKSATRMNCGSFSEQVEGGSLEGARDSERGCPREERWEMGVGVGLGC